MINLGFESISNEYIEFLVGRDGEFDQLVSSTIRRCKRTIRDDNSSLVLVLPYMTAEDVYKRQPVLIAGIGRETTA